MDSRKKDIIEMLKENEKDVFLNYVLGLEYVSEGNLKDAVCQFEKVIYLDKNYIAAYYQCGILYYQLNNKTKALEILNEGLGIATKKQSNKDIAEFKSAIINIENDLL